MIAAILAIGDEIVAGITTDTNSPFAAQVLRGAGIDCIGFFAVPDDESAIRQALDRAFADADFILTTGGLGPTVDDLTTASIAAHAGLPLRLHRPSLEAIEARFQVMGMEMPENNRKQALLPEGADPIPNPQGTAPGFFLRLSTDHGPRIVATLPGVPREMRRMLEETVVPRIVATGGAAVIGSRVFSTVGLSESRLDELLRDVVPPGEGRMSFRAAFPRLQARVTVTADTPEELVTRLDRVEARVSARLGDHLYAIGDEGLEETVGRLLRERRVTLAVAESCTGGLIGHRLTEVPGSSDYFLLGIVAYSNASKQSLLGVSEETLVSDGAVSEATVREMARGAREVARADFGLATSGIAGPGGGTLDKPVGTVCIGLAWDGGEWSRTYHFAPRSRSWVKEVTAQVALNRLRKHLLELDSGQG